MPAGEAVGARRHVGRPGDGGHGATAARIRWVAGRQAPPTLSASTKPMAGARRSPPGRPATTHGDAGRGELARRGSSPRAESRSTPSAPPRTRWRSMRSGPTRSGSSTGPVRSGSRINTSGDAPERPSEEGIGEQAGRSARRTTRAPCRCGARQARRAPLDWGSRAADLVWWSRPCPRGVRHLGCHSPPETRWPARPPSGWPRPPACTVAGRPGSTRRAFPERGPAMTRGRIVSVRWPWARRWVAKSTCNDAKPLRVPSAHSKLSSSDHTKNPQVEARGDGIVARPMWASR